MSSALHSITIVGDQVQEAAEFYGRTFSAPTVQDGASVDVDLHGVGRLRLEPGAGAAEGFPGFVVTYILAQPGEVRAVMEAAARHGAEILKPAKKALFGSFAGSFRSPDGVIWKLASQSNKDTTAPSPSPKPLETTVILGVSDPKKSVPFYVALGMTKDRDYGSKYIDFLPEEGSVRLCLMQSPVLAKDVGHRGRRVDTPPLTLVRRSTVTDGGAATPVDGDAETVTDPDGFRWAASDEQPAR
ncbi:VOC family protein [Microbacterium sp. MYb62]|uniref:VOC family protein n=1 Tax=Microbacterium sp. MYb62 TaxID=1848690 RepID=UPI0011B0ABFC|nr:VOC family protein [Microbacterium sp. MYb62]